MLQEGNLRQDFRFRGFPNKSMESPRQPVTKSIAEDKIRNEEKFVKVFGRSSIFDPARPTVDEGHRGLVYGSDQIDNSPRAKGMHGLNFSDKSETEERKLRLQKEDAQNDIAKFKQEKMMQNFQREEEKKRDYDMLTKYYPWDRLKEGHGAPKDNGNRRRKFLETDVSPRDNPQYTTEPLKAHRGHDLFIDTLGGPAGTVVRGEHGYPALQSMPDPRVGAYRSPGPGGSQEQERRKDFVEEERKIAQQEAKIRELKKELEFLKSPRDHQANGREPAFDPRDSGGPQMNGYYGKRDLFERQPPADFDMDRSRRMAEQRSLDLENTRGGAGAPLRDDRGKAITRFPVTMERDDYGASKIREEIPGKRYTLPDDENPIYNPWGRPGGGAPVKDRYGNVNTNTFGNFEKRKDSADQRKHVRAKEVMLHDLRQGMEEQQRNKEMEIRNLKAPQGELAELVRRGQVGKPRRDPITGTLTNQHLPQSDVVKVDKENEQAKADKSVQEKVNYQPKEESEKRQYYDELSRLAEERSLNRQLEKMREQQEANRHFEQVDSLWGRFGGGAPKDKIVRKKVNLDNALHHYDHFRETRSEDLHRRPPQPQYGLGMSPVMTTRGDESLPDPRKGYGLGAPVNKPVNPGYQKAFFEDDIRHKSPEQTPRYVKNTTQSGSKNLYEYPVNKTTQPVQPAVPPFATQGSAAY